MALKINRSHLPLFFIIIMVCELFAQSNSGSARALDVFLNVQSRSNFERWKDSTGLFEVCPIQDSTQGARYAELFKLVQKGDEYAFRISLLLSRCFNGEYSEEYLNSGGAFFDNNPGLFLQITTINSIPFSQIDDMILFLPLSLVDDFKDQALLLDKRIRCIIKCKNKTNEVMVLRLVKSLRNQKQKIEIIHSNK